MKSASAHLFTCTLLSGFCLFGAACTFAPPADSRAVTHPHEPESYTQALAAIRSRIIGFERYFVSERYTQASDEVLFLVNLAARLKQFEPDGLGDADRRTTYFSQVADLGLAADLTQHDSSKRLRSRVFDGINEIVSRFNRLAEGFGGVSPIADSERSLTASAVSKG